MNAHQRKLSRRTFIKKSGAGAAGISLMPLTFPNASLGNPLNTGPEVHLFSKHLQFLNYTDMSEAAAEMGFDGLDLTVRPKGHVLPERVADDLPKAVEAMKKHGLKSRLMTTNVKDPHNALESNLLETASAQGIEHYRMGWLKYSEEKSIPQQLAEFSRQFAELEALNARLSLKGAYQNHAGLHVGAPIWDTYEIIKDLTSGYLGAQYDIRHAVVEGGSSWELGLRLIKDHINTIVIKDFKWGKVNGTWQPVNTALGEGMVDFDRYFSLLKTYGIRVPISLHLEYDLGGAEHGAQKLTMDRKTVFALMKKDLNFVKTAWSKAGSD